MRTFLSTLVVAAILLVSNSANAQPMPGNECPDYLLFIFNGEFHYQAKDCQTGSMTNKSLRYPTKVKTGCSGMMGCNCSTAPSNLSQLEYADPKERVFTAFGSGPTSLIGPTGTKKVKAGDKVFLLTSLRLKGKPTGGGDNEMLCTVSVGCELDPATPHDDTGVLVGNKLTFQGTEFTVSMKGTTTPPQDPPQTPQP